MDGQGKSPPNNSESLNFIDFIFVYFYKGYGMKNFLLENVEYKIEETRLGVWRSFSFQAVPISQSSRPIKPCLVFPFSIIPGEMSGDGKTGSSKRRSSRGEACVGNSGDRPGFIWSYCYWSACCQYPVWAGAGLDGLIAVGQVAIGLRFGMGQLATGLTAIGQLGIGRYVLAQIGFGDYVWSTKRADPEAVEYFKSLLVRIIDWWQHYNNFTKKNCQSIPQ